ncbi:16096_t:CDS:2 [Entrophospora sp. SA101]|nr:16096_t:CDS:2 [Entrophospora sp. SA101]
MTRLVTRCMSSATSQQQPSLVVPNDEFLVQIHDEDYQYESLMAGFIVSSGDVALPIQSNNPGIKALLFPDLFPTGCGHYEYVKKLSKVQAPLVLATFLIPEPGKEAQLPKLRMLAEIVFKFLNISDLKCAF